jgi:hypothetical protein
MFNFKFCFVVQCLHQFGAESMNGNEGTGDISDMVTEDSCGITAYTGGPVKLPITLNSNTENKIRDSSNSINVRHKLTYEETIHLLEQKIQVCHYSVTI